MRLGGRAHDRHLVTVTVGPGEAPAETDRDAGEAVRQSLAAFEWLEGQGCRQFLFKYCSTFDSTPQGNIGPVGEALARKLNAFGVPSCPAFPTTGRTVYQGHLFVGNRLLNESGMENHPLNPMTDPDLKRQRKVVDAFLAAARTGNFEALVEVLDPDVVFRADRGRMAIPGARPVATGVGDVAEQVQGLHAVRKVHQSRYPNIRMVAGFVQPEPSRARGH